MRSWLLKSAMMRTILNFFSIFLNSWCSTMGRSVIGGLFWKSTWLGIYFPTIGWATPTTCLLLDYYFDTRGNEKSFNFCPSLFRMLLAQKCSFPSNHRLRKSAVTDFTIRCSFQPWPWRTSWVPRKQASSTTEGSGIVVKEIELNIFLTTESGPANHIEPSQLTMKN